MSIVQNQHSQNLQAMTTAEPTFDTGRVAPMSSTLYKTIVSMCWRHRWPILISTVSALVIAMAYLLIATPIYTCSASLYVQQTGPKLLTDTAPRGDRADSYLFTQTDVLKSSSVLSTALDQSAAWKLKTFHKVNNLLRYMQEESIYRVDVGKKSDVLTISLDSPYPAEASQVVNNIVDSYINYESKQNKTTASEVLKLLQSERANLDTERARLLKAMLDFKKNNGALSLQDDKGHEKKNIILERLARLSDSLTQIELNEAKALAERDVAKAMLGDPKLISAYVESLEAKGNDAMDREYGELRAQLRQHELEMTLNSLRYSENHRNMIEAQAQMAQLRGMITAKERQLAEAHFNQINKELEAFKASETDIRATYKEQQQLAMDLNARATEYERLEADVQRTERQCDLVDADKRSERDAGQRRAEHPGAGAGAY